MKFRSGDFDRIISIVLSGIALVLVLVYLGIKTLVCPMYTPFDKSLAISIGETVEGDWINIVANSNVSYLPEARADLLYSLGLYLDEE
jgi:hypothetical protein